MWHSSLGDRRRSLNAVNIGSVDQRASKLLAVKVGGLKKKSANRPRPHLNHSAQIRLHQGSKHSQTLTASNFEALRPTNFILTAKKDLNLLKTISKIKRLAAF